MSELLELLSDIIDDINEWEDYEEDVKTNPWNN